MAATPPTRIDDEVYADAVAASAVMGRSVAKQLSHWARLGRELEATVVASTRRRRAEAALTGDERYDELAGDEQALVRARWSERIAERSGQVDVGAAKHAQGLPYLTLDAEGGVVLVHPDGSIEKV